MAQLPKFNTENEDPSRVGVSGHRAGIQGGKYRWTNGEIPYMFSCRHGLCWKKHEMKNIEKAIQQINRLLSPCIKIRYRITL